MGGTENICRCMNKQTSKQLIMYPIAIATYLFRGSMSISTYLKIQREREHLSNCHRMLTKLV